MHIYPTLKAVYFPLSFHFLYLGASSFPLHLKKILNIYMYIHYIEPVAQAYNPSYLGSWNWENHNSKSALAKKNS
jgi:hypothetical protein